MNSEYNEWLAEDASHPKLGISLMLEQALQQWVLGHNRVFQCSGYFRA